MKTAGGLLLLSASAFGAAAAQPDDPSSVHYPTLPQVAATAEAFISPGWQVVSKAEGDLNGDGRADVALALWTEQASRATSREERLEAPSYRLLIGVADPNGGYRLVADNKTLLRPPDPFGVNLDPLDADALRIVRGSLDISREYLRGHYRYRFRWSDGAFRLIGYEFGGSDGHCVTVTSINYLARRATIEVEALSEEGGGQKVRRPTKRVPLATLEQASSEAFYPEQLVVGPWPACR